MTGYTNPCPAGAREDLVLASATGAGLPAVYVNGQGNPTASLTVFMSRDLTSAEQTTLANIVSAATPPAPRVPRTLVAIYTDLQALTAAQKTSVWTDLSSGTPRKYLAGAGRNAAAIAALDWAATDSGATGNALTAARLRVAAMWCQDNPTYLVNPDFLPAVNVPGDQVAP
jgi:hypothetical protein